MGRRDIRDRATDDAFELHVKRVSLDSGGYDHLGTYWGSGQGVAPLWWGADEDGDVELFARAGDYESACREFAKSYPHATFRKAAVEIDEVVIEQFVEAYLETALWSSTDDDGNPIDREYSTFDVADCARDSAVADCRSFLEQAKDLIEGEDLTTVAHDFWLTRNGHGAGFWDGDYPENGDKLSALSREFGEVDVYVGDDGKVYL